MTGEIFIAGLKLIHVAAIAVWVGGLLSMPYLIWQRHGLLRARGPDEVHRLHRIVRLVHIGLVSPAAVIAVISGTALIFLRETYGMWFWVKLIFVAVLVLAHNFANRSLREVFADDPVNGDDEPGGEHADFSGARALALGVVIAIGSSGVLLAVLGKPGFDLGPLLPHGMWEPGALGDLLGRFNPWARS